MATKCPCIRESMRKKYGEKSEACCAKQEVSTTPSDIISKGISVAGSIFDKVTGTSATRPKKKPLRGPNWNPNLSKGGSVTKTKWTRRNKNYPK